jgi:hypothetical protein
LVSLNTKHERRRLRENLPEPVLDASEKIGIRSPDNVRRFGAYIECCA